MISIDFQQVSDFLYENFERVTFSDNVFRARCQLCGDSKKSKEKRRFKLYYTDPTKVSYNCFNCGKAGDFIDLVSKIKCVSRKEAFRLVKKKFTNEEDIRNAFKRPKKNEAKPVNKDPDILDDILKDCFNTSHIAKSSKEEILLKELHNFKLKRKIGYDIYVAFRGTFANRIIIPIKHDGHIVYFQGRAIVDEQSPKYLNPKVEKHNIILNKEMFKKSKYIIVTEGILDALSVGDQGTAALGVSYNDTFLEKLLELPSKGIIIAVDNDSAGLDLLDKKFFNKDNRLNSIFKDKVKYFFMPKEYKNIKDLNELKVKENIKNMYDFVVTNSYTRLEAAVKLIQLKMQLKPNTKITK